MDDELKVVIVLRKMISIRTIQWNPSWHYNNDGGVGGNCDGEQKKKIKEKAINVDKHGNESC